MNNALFLLAGAIFGILIGGAFRYRGHNTINFKLNHIMATLAEFQAAFAEINETTNNIAADIERLTGQIGAGGMSDADETAALTELQGIAARLRTIADTTPEETPTEPTA